MKACLKQHITYAALPILLLAAMMANAQSDTANGAGNMDSLELYEPGVPTDPTALSDTVYRHSDSLKPHNPRKATFLAFMPGLGQIYNRRYWKLPIVYGALGAGIYFINMNHVEYRRHLDAFYTQTDDIPDNDELSHLDPRQLIENQNYYRRQRDLSIIITVALYGLQILDAYVDAHLFHYDISDDLTMQWEPRMLQNYSTVPTPGVYGLGLTFNLK